MLITCNQISYIQFFFFAEMKGILVQYSYIIRFKPLCVSITRFPLSQRSLTESSGGVVVGALASHQCGPGSISRLSVICELSLLVLFSGLRDFPQGTLVSPLLKNLHLIKFDLY